MKRLFFLVLLVTSAMVFTVPAVARVDINVGIGLPLPPPIAFPAPPDVIAVPDASDVYAVPDVDADLYFWNGWWWRLWDGRWYRSHSFDQGWVYYNDVPAFYFNVDPDWRRYYRERNWQGHPWNYQRIPYQEFSKKWKSWQKSKYWEKHGTWGVQSYQPRPQRERQQLIQQRQQQYRQRPEVQRSQRQPHAQRPHEQKEQRGTPEKGIRDEERH